jgi:hypothetical protein
VQVRVKPVCVRCPGTPEVIDPDRGVHDDHR